MSKLIEQLVKDAERCKTLGVPFNPELPENFNDTPNQHRPESHQRWWHRAFIVAETVEDWDAFYAKGGEDARKYWTESRGQWLQRWHTGIRYTVRCLDGDAWDRSTNWGMFATLDAALACVANGPDWRRGTTQ